MKILIKLLKWIGCGVLFYPFGLMYAYFDSGNNVSELFWLEILIIDIVACFLLFLFVDFGLIQRIKRRNQKTVSRIKFSKNHIQIRTLYMVSAQYKRALLFELSRFFDLKNSDDIPIKDEMLVNQINEQDVGAYREYYEEGNFKCSFDVFLEWCSFTLSEVRIYIKDSTVCVASINFEPDGDIHTVWIDVFDAKYLSKLRNVIRRVRD